MLRMEEGASTKKASVQSGRDAIRSRQIEDRTGQDRTAIFVRSGRDPTQVCRQKKDSRQGFRPPISSPCLNYQSSSSSLSLSRPLMALCLARNASANPPARLPPPMLLGVARPEFGPLLVEPRLMPLSRAGEASGLRATGRLAGGAGGVGFARAPLTAMAGVGTARGGAAGGGGGGGAARACSISST